MTKESPLLRISLMVTSIIVLLAAMWAGLLRLGWQWPVLQPTLILSHGPLMVSGFFGTLISIERVVAMNKRWPYIGPILSGLGGLALMFGVPGLPGPLLLTLGSLMMVVMFIVIIRQHAPAPLYTIVMALGAVAWMIGNVLWLFGFPIYQIVLWWGGFLVLTIAGERLELGRLIKITRTKQMTFLAATALYILGLIIMLPTSTYDLGVRLAGAGTIFLGVWLLRNDIARRTVRQTGLTRYIAIALLSGYFWMLVSGAVGLVYGGIPAGPIYDTMLHAIFLGFVFSMVFGHAPIIFPAVLHIPINYKPYFYVHLVLLHTSLILRTIGSLTNIFWARQWGGLINAIALLLFVIVTGPISFLSKEKKS